MSALPYSSDVYEKKPAKILFICQMELAFIIISVCE